MNNFRNLAITVLVGSAATLAAAQIENSYLQSAGAAAKATADAQRSSTASESKRASATQSAAATRQTTTAARQDELYAAGTQAMNDGRWQQAVTSFDEVTKAGGTR
jgi:outer membrane protein assembly factor BamD (BamD/ComL family)